MGKRTIMIQLRPMTMAAVPILYRVALCLRHVTSILRLRSATDLVSLKVAQVAWMELRVISMVMPSTMTSLSVNSQHLSTIAMATA